MCVNPVFLPEKGLVACHYCWRCKRDRVEDLIGRCIAESTTATRTLALTLTYRGDVVESVVHRYGDFQRFMKRLRWDGYAVRYIVVGEYGSRKGRVHWHAVLFFRGKVPELEVNVRRNWRYWPHGFVYAQVPDYKGFAYVLKYVLKDEKSEVSTHQLSMSKKPPLGFEWFKGLAAEYVGQGLSPQNPTYSFANSFDNKGRRRVYYLHGRSRELFAEEYIRRYREAHGTDYPFSEFLEEMEDSWLRAELEQSLWDNDVWARHFAKKGFWGPPRKAEPETGPVQYLVGGDVLLVRYSDGKVDLHAKDETWHVNGIAELGRALDLIGIEKRLSRALLEEYSGKLLQSGCSPRSGSEPSGEGSLGLSRRREWPERSAKLRRRF